MLTHIDTDINRLTSHM